MHVCVYVCVYCAPSYLQTSPRHLSACLTFHPLLCECVRPSLHLCFSHNASLLLPIRPELIAYAQLPGNRQLLLPWHCRGHPGVQIAVWMNDDWLSMIGSIIYVSLSRTHTHTHTHTHIHTHTPTHTHIHTQMHINMIWVPVIGSHTHTQSPILTLRGVMIGCQENMTPIWACGTWSCSMKCVWSGLKLRLCVRVCVCVQEWVNWAVK